MKKAVLIINIGTPDNDNKKSVFKFLYQFLNDPMVIDLPWLLRKILVNMIIIPFRIRKSTNLYKRLWTKQGSPLLINTQKMADKLQQIQNEYTVFVAMRYGNPSLKNVLQDIYNQGFTSITVFPMYPQYSLSTTQTTIDEIKKITHNWKGIKLKFVEQFYYHKYFVDAFVNNIRNFDIDNFDHILFSFHGLPLRHVKKEHERMKNTNCECEQNIHSKQAIKCYNNSCLHTADLITSKLNLKSTDYTMCYQSRLTKRWLQPFTDATILERAKKGDKKILVISPSFVADCLETTVEIGLDYKELFLKAGGQDLTLVPALNDSDMWVKAVLDIILNHSQNL